MMSSATGSVCPPGSKNMGFEEGCDSGDRKSDNTNEENGDQKSDNTNEGNRSSSCHATETEVEEDDDTEEGKINLQLGPKCSLKEQLEKDKDDESLRRWKEQLLGSVDVSSVGESLDPDVKILDLSIVSPGRSDIFLPIPVDGGPKGSWFTLKEGSQYSLKFSFRVNNNIVSGLKYTNTVWKTGVKVDSTKQMIGTFSPQQEPYTHVFAEETTPSGIFARGSYAARSKFLDDDNKCYLEINYTFDIRKEWAAT